MLRSSISLFFQKSENNGLDTNQAKNAIKMRLPGGLWKFPWSLSRTPTGTFPALTSISNSEFVFFTVFAGFSAEINVTMLFLKIAVQPQTFQEGFKIFFAKHVD